MFEFQEEKVLLVGLLWYLCSHWTCLLLQIPNEDKQIVPEMSTFALFLDCLRRNLRHTTKLQQRSAHRMGNGEYIYNCPKVPSRWQYFADQ